MLAEEQNQERVTSLYQEGLVHYENKEWQPAHDCFSLILDIDPDYENASHLCQDARRRLQWSKSILGRVAQRFSKDG